MHEDERRAQCHEMLLRLAGSAPDDLLTQCRDWLDAGRFGEIGRAVTHAAAALRVPVPAADVDLLVALSSGSDASRLAFIDIADPQREPTHDFAPTRLLADAVRSELLERSGTPPADPEWDARLEDDICAAAVSAAQAEPAAVALWRAWRFPADLSPWPAPRRVFVVEAHQGAELVGLTARLQHRLRDAGETSPQVETYATGAQLPAYQRFARAGGALLWARTPDREIQVAELFPRVDAGGDPALDAERDLAVGPDHPRVEPAERERLLAYLRRGEALLLTEDRLADPLDPSAEGVPVNVMTDGYWIWTDAATHFLDRHDLRPDARLVEHIQQRGYEFPVVDGAAAHRALQALRDLPPDRDAQSHR